MKKYLTAAVAVSLLMLTACGSSVPEQTTISVSSETVAETTSAAETEVEETEVEETEAAIERTVLYPFNQNGLWGMMDEEGTIVVEPAYFGIYSFSDEGLAEIVISEESDDEGRMYYSGLINRYGDVVVEPIYQYILDSSEGYQVAVDENDISHVFDSLGNELFTSESYLSQCCDGLFKAIYLDQDGMSYYGYIDVNGEWAIEPQFTYGANFSMGKALVETTEGISAIIDTSGTVLQEFPDEIIDSLSEDIYVFKEAETYMCGYRNVDGTLLMPAIYSSAQAFEDGYAIVSVSDGSYMDYYGVIDSDGKTVISPKYGYITYLGEGMFSVSETNEYYFNDWFLKKALFSAKQGQVTGFDYYLTGDFMDGFASVTDGESTWFSDRNGDMSEQLPSYPEAGTMKIMGSLIQATFDNDMKYLELDGTVLWSNSKEHKISDDIVIQEYKQKPDYFTTVYYPQIIKHPDQTVADSLNEQFKEWFLLSDDYTAYDDGFIVTMDSGFSLETVGGVTQIMQSGYTYSGGAHGYPSLEYFQVDIETGEVFQLADLFRTGVDYLTILSDLVDAGIEERLLNEDDFYVFEDAFTGFTYEPNFYIKDNEQLVIYFYPYEIASYADGFVEIPIYFTEFADVLNRSGSFYKAIQE